MVGERQPNRWAGEGQPLLPPRQNLVEGLQNSVSESRLPLVWQVGTGRITPDQIELDINRSAQNLEMKRRQRKLFFNR